MEMKTRFRLRRLLLPVTFPDSCSLLFSDLAYEREFMVRMWCLLDIYSKDGFEDGSVYPSQYTRENGPVPIQMASNSDTYHRSSGPAPASFGKGFEYTWNDDMYRFAILGLRAVSSPLLIWSDLCADMQDWGQTTIPCSKPQESRTWKLQVSQVKDLRGTFTFDLLGSRNQGST